ncbi:unnamed protein product [Adineta ricciae]|uniref:Macro domain-containing protein n=1 Tax=Adineta ricciae TaxID=249248 RepID=A0A816B151_ADIRI|nr:unnamed protein product [Adineta ricciae]
MDTPVLLIFHIKTSSNSPDIRSVVIKDYFSNLTANVKVLYPTQIHSGLLLCKSKRTEEKLLNMRHTLSNGSTIHLSPPPCSLFQQTKCFFDSHLKQFNEIRSHLQQCLPFLHTSSGKSEMTSDGSILLEGHIFILNSIHSYLLHKAAKQHQTNLPDSYELHSGNLTITVMRGKLMEQNVDSILIPMNSRYKIHTAIDEQIRAFGKTNLTNYLRESAQRDTRVFDGKIIIYPNREFPIPVKVLIMFVVPRLINDETTKEKYPINSYQSTYEQIILNTLQTIDQSGITSLAMPVLEPSVKSFSERRSANEMAVRAMVSAFRRFSMNSSIKLKRILVVDHHVQITRMSKRVKQYQSRTQTKASTNVNFTVDDEQTFTNVFGVPKVSDVPSSAGESDEETESEEYQLPYTDHARS